MKLRPPKELLDNIRESIRTRRSDIDDNRLHRKKLIRDIQAIKRNIKTGENLCSILEAGLIVETSYLRDDLRKKRETLTHVRQSLLTAEIDYAIQKAICRALHEQLDRLNAPFDPTRATSAGRSK